MHAVEIKAIKMEELSRVSCIRAYHVYKNIWDAAIGEVLDLASFEEIQKLKNHGRNS